MGAWVAAIPVIGKFLEKVTGVVSEMVTDKDKANELTFKLRELFAEFIEQYHQYVLKMEGEFADLIKLGFIGYILAFLRAGWRPILQWGLTVDIMKKLILMGVSWETLQAEILFTLGLAGLRTLEKKLPFGKK